MSADLPQDPNTAPQVTRMQAELQADPEYAELFQPIGNAAIELSTSFHLSKNGKKIGLQIPQQMAHG